MAERACFQRSPQIFDSPAHLRLADASLDARILLAGEDLGEAVARGGAISLRPYPSFSSAQMDKRPSPGRPLSNQGSGGALIDFPAWLISVEVRLAVGLTQRPARSLDPLLS